MHLIFYIYKNKYEVESWLLTSLKCQTNVLRKAFNQLKTLMLKLLYQQCLRSRMNVYAQGMLENCSFSVDADTFHLLSSVSLKQGCRQQSGHWVQVSIYKFD